MFFFILLVSLIRKIKKYLYDFKSYCFIEENFSELDLRFIRVKTDLKVQQTLTKIFIKSFIENVVMRKPIN